jgi:hypothetical protein
MMARVARRHGGSVTAPRVAAAGVRPLREIALENAIEGCVRETYGAAEGLFQSRAASDPRIRRAMRRISADETRHGALSFAVASWLDTRLGPRDRRQIRDAQVAEVEALGRRVGRRRAPELVALAGVPTPAQAETIVSRLRATLWHA